MLKVYKKIDHRIFKIQDLMNTLVVDVFCGANRQKCFTKISSNETLKKLYENTHSDWFKTNVEEIYLKCRKLTPEERALFIKTFKKNNEIELLCSRPNEVMKLSVLNSDVAKLIIAFFKDFYDKFLGWKEIQTEYGTKKEYYDDLIWENEFISCPCCGYGIIKTIYDKGHSAFDHYLPIKHYPFSVVNFNNLFPLCNDCNSGAKASKNILAKNKKIFYPFNNNHPEIKFEITIEPKSLIKFISKVKKKEERINEKDMKVGIICDSKYKEEVESWDSIFEINSRFFGRIADHSVSWMNDVRENYRETKKTFPECFDSIIKVDSNKDLGFLKSPFLTDLKKYDSFILALEESAASSKIR